MMKKIQLIILFTLCIASSFVGSTQSNVRESVYLHLNSDQLIAGEMLYFSAYCVSQKTGRPSLLSKILYVEIVGENGAIHQEKIALEDGHGSGDLFISSIFSTGTYQVLAYTRWMTNFNDYCQVPFTIINPFEEYNVAKPDQQLKMDFYHQGDKLIAGLENKVTFKVSNPIAPILKYSGKLVDSDGETILKTQHDEFGLGQFKFTPKSSTTYQIILEDEYGQFSFFNLPKVAPSGSLLQIEDMGSHLEARVSASPAALEIYTLKLMVETGETFDYTVSKNAAALINKGDFSNQLASLEAIDREGNVIAFESIVLNSLDQKTVLADGGAYSKRASVSIPLDLEAGKYSVSVRRKDETLNNAAPHAYLFRFDQQVSNAAVDVADYLQILKEADPQLVLNTATINKTKPSPDSVKYLPETREAVLAGTLVNPNNQPLAYTNLSLVFPQNPYQHRTIKTDALGNFQIPFNSSLQTRYAYIGTPDSDIEIEISVEDPFLSKYPEFEYLPVILDSSQVVEIVEKSIINQLENAFYKPKPQPQPRDEWYIPVPYDLIYVLDEYKRFPTLKETFTEFIQNANFRENRNPVIKPFVPANTKNTDLPPLVLLDGLPVEGKDLVNLSAFRIESIGILNKRYYLGELVVDGVVDIKTKEGLDKLDIELSYKKISVEAVSPVRKYQFPTYGSDQRVTVADQRVQLYWDPKVEIKEPQTTSVDFYTSDVPGRYEMLVEGFTIDGLPVTITKSFEVTD